MQRSIRMLSIQQASQRLKVAKHTLRFWEQELNGVLAPLRTQGGQRRYTSEHLYLIEEIKSLKRKGLSLVDIKEKLNDIYNAEQDNSNSNKIDLLANQVAEMVKTAIYRFLETEKDDN